MNVEGTDAQMDHEEIDIILKPQSKNNDFERLERLLLQTLEIVMIYDGAELEVLEECLSVVDDVKKELAFLRAKIYKEIFRRKFASIM